MKTFLKKTGYKYTDIAIQYINDILNNKIIACDAVKKACRRFCNDYHNIKNESFLFNYDFSAVEEVCCFVESLILPDIKKPLQLLPWEVFIYANFYGWCYKDNKNRKRFRTAFIMVARKNGKTSGLLYGMNLYNLITAPAAESYLISATDDQSEKSFNEIKQIIKNNTALDEVCSCFSSAVSFNNNCRLSFFSSQASALDGYRPSFAALDEFWNFSNNKPLTAMRYGSRARLNGQILIITTAGTGIDSPCYIEYTKAKKILNNDIQDDSYFALIYEYDEADDWKNENLLIKSNPSLGTFLSPDILKNDLSSAIATPSERPDYIAKTCNRFTQDNITAWIPLEKWQQPKEKIDFNDDYFVKAPAVGGLDLSSVSDLTVFTLCFKKENKYYLKHRFYIPKETLLYKYKFDNPLFLEWVDRGIITATEGETIDYSVLINDIIKDAHTYNIKEICFDRWQSNLIIKELNEKLPDIIFIDYDQSLKNFANPTKEFERQVLNNNIIDNNPVMAWALGNVCIKPINGNYKPLKKYKSSTKRIDPVITSIMSLDRLQNYYSNLDKIKNNEIELSELLQCFDY